MIGYFGKRKSAWKVTASTKPQTRYPLSGVCQILDDKGYGYCHIKFTWALVADCGLAMPRGVSSEEPSHLLAMRMSENSWYIFCCYVNSTERRVIWEEPGLPHWVRSIKRTQVKNVTRSDRDGEG
jgi:hypothetical protein